MRLTLNAYGTPLHTARARTRATTRRPRTLRKKTLRHAILWISAGCQVKATIHTHTRSLSLSLLPLALLPLLSPTAHLPARAYKRTPPYAYGCMYTSHATLYARIRQLSAKADKSIFNCHFSSRLRILRSLGDGGDEKSFIRLLSSILLPQFCLI